MATTFVHLCAIYFPSVTGRFFRATSDWFVVPSAAYVKFCILLNLSLQASWLDLTCQVTWETLRSPSPSAPFLLSSPAALSVSFCNNAFVSTQYITGAYRIFEANTAQSGNLLCLTLHKTMFTLFHPFRRIATDVNGWWSSCRDHISKLWDCKHSVYYACVSYIDCRICVCMWRSIVFHFLPEVSQQSLI